MGSENLGPESLLGRQMASYRLERVLGVGASGAVYFATRVDDAATEGTQVEAPDDGLPPALAIKVLVIPWQLSPPQASDFQARFLREAETLRQLHHPNILPVLASGQDPATGHLYMLLPYVGRTLADRLSASASGLPFEEVASVLAQVAGALDYAHSQGVIHRDVKPANILLGEDGVAYLADFGILRLLDTSRTKLTTTGSVLGTPEYMAPEQALGETVGPAADRYALAVVLYEMVTGRTPFAGDSVARMLVRQAQEPPPIPRSYRNDLPQPAESVILKGLAKRPEDRFALSTQLSSAFADGLAGMLSPLVTPTATQRAPTLRDNPQAETPAPLPWTPYPEAPGVSAAGSPSSSRSRGRLVWGALGGAILLLLTAAILATLIRPDLVRAVFGGKPAATASTTASAGFAQASVSGASGLPSGASGQGVSSTPRSTTGGPTVTAGSGNGGNGGAGNGSPTNPASPSPTDTPIPAPVAGTLAEFPIPTAGSGPAAITSGPDGALWFTEIYGNRVGRISPGGAITEFGVPTPNSAPERITTGPDGALWFTENSGRIGRITTGGSITEYSVPTSGSRPNEITTGADGALWFTEFGANQIGRITTWGSITEYSIPTPNCHPSGIVSGPDGNLWFTENGSNRVGRITTGGSVTEFVLPVGSSNLESITVGPDGALWFADAYANANRIWRITTSGSMSEFPVPTTPSGPDGITRGPDGNLWFTEYSGNQIGRITTGGNLTEFPLPNANSAAEGIVSGPDGALWFVENSGNRVGRMDA